MQIKTKSGEITPDFAALATTNSWQKRFYQLSSVTKLYKATFLGYGSGA